MNKTTFTLSLIFLPLAAIADNYNYDDETKVDVTDGTWDDDNTGHNGGWDGSDSPDFEISFDNETTGINSIAADSGIKRVYRSGAAIVIESTRDIDIVTYRIGDPAIRHLRLISGSNSFELPAGIYIIKGRKYKL